MRRKSEAKDAAARYALMETLRLYDPVRLMCRVFDVSPSGFYAWLKRPPSRHAGDETRLEVEIEAAHQRTRETYGPERLQQDLAAPGVQVGGYRIKRIREKLGLRCKQKRTFQATTDSQHGLPVAENLLDQDFTTVWAPNEVWLSDPTYMPTGEGWLYRVGHKGPVHRGDRRLRVGRAHDDGTRQSVSLASGVDPAARSGTDPPFGSGQPVWRPCLSSVAGAVWFPDLHESESQRLG